MPELDMLDNCIQYHESALFHDKWLMSPSVLVLEEKTLQYLKELKEIRGKPKIDYTHPEATSH